MINTNIFGGVALRKESVDRNDKSKKLRMMKCKSLSARRAWIEIVRGVSLLRKITVALRKESVDRNRADVGSRSTLGGSLSARRAWIEMPKL